MYVEDIDAFVAINLFLIWIEIELSKQSWGWWFETPSHPLRRHSNEYLNPCRAEFSVYLHLLSFLNEIIRVGEIGTHWKH